MKNLVLIIPILLTMPTYATTMCAKNDTVAVVLDPTIGASGYANNNSLGTWNVTFPYGYISGISACINSNHGKTTGGWVENLTDVNPDGIERTVIGSERYGTHCWCKVTHPVASRWVYRNTYGSGSACANSCSSCGYAVQSNENMRVGLFGSMSN